MKRMLVYAYTEFNLGDDLFIKVLCERYPDSRFLILAPGRYKRSFRAFRNMRVIAADSVWVKGLRKLGLKYAVQKLLAWRCGGIVHIGGSLFMEGEGWREYLRQAEEIRPKSKPYYLLGANFGPYRDEDYYLQYKEVFRQYTDICFRETYSYERFADLSHVRLAPDIVFQLQPPPVADEGYVVLSVIKPSAKQLQGFDERYYEKMKEISVYFLERGYAVRLMSFCRQEGDEEAAQRIMALLPEELAAGADTYFYTGDMQAALAVIAGSSLVVATRFHAMILGWVMNKPAFPVAYSSKMLHVMQDAGFTGGYTDFNQLEGLQPEEVYLAMQDGRVQVSKLALQAERHFARLDAELSLPGRRVYESQTEYS